LKIIRESTARYGKPGRQGKHVVMVTTVNVGRRRLLGVDAYIKGKGNSEARTATRMLAEVRKRRAEKSCGDGACDASLIFSLRNTDGAFEGRTPPLVAPAIAREAETKPITERDE